MQVAKCRLCLAYPRAKLGHVERKGFWGGGSEGPRHLCLLGTVLGWFGSGTNYVSRVRVPQAAFSWGLQSSVLIEGGGRNFRQWEGLPAVGGTSSSGGSTQGW